MGISGGIDSAVCLALAAKVFDPSKITGVILPERDSSPDSEIMARELAGQLGIKTIKEEITDALDGFKCYGRQG